MQLACAKLMIAIYEADFLDSSYSYRPVRSAKEAVQDLTFDLQYGGYGYVVEADVRGFFDNMGHDWTLKMLSVRWYTGDRWNGSTSGDRYPPGWDSFTRPRECVFALCVGFVV